MKKYLASLLSIVVFIVLTGCGGGDSSNSDPTNI